MRDLGESGTCSCSSCPACQSNQTPEDISLLAYTVGLCSSWGLQWRCGLHRWIQRCPMDIATVQVFFQVIQIQRDTGLHRWRPWFGGGPCPRRTGGLQLGHKPTQWAWRAFQESLLALLQCGLGTPHLGRTSRLPWTPGQQRRTEKLRKLRTRD